MQIVLARHAEPEWVVDGLQVDHPPLTSRGFAQARLLGERLAEEHWDEIYVSPLLRAQQTAAPLLELIDRPLVIAPWLEEIRSPLWHGTPAEKVEAAYKAERAMKAHERWDGIPGGEPVRDFTARIRAGGAEFLAERGIRQTDHDLPVWDIEGDDRRILCVAHAGTNSVAACWLLGLDPVPWEWDRFIIGHASITRLDSVRLGDGYTFGLSKLSDVEHLPADVRTF